MYITKEEVLVRLLLSAVLGSAIGIEREYHNRPAGLRTHILVSLVSALIMIVGIEIHEKVSGSDPTRLAAQVVSGIGFLGAGTIIKTGSSIKGLTTAATLWANAGIGLAVGSGLYYASVLAVLIVIVTLFVLSRIERYISKLNLKTIRCKAADDPSIQIQFSESIAASGGDVKSVHMSRIEDKFEHTYMSLTYKLSVKGDFDRHKLAALADSIDGIYEMDYQGIDLISKDIGES